MFQPSHLHISFLVFVAFHRPAQSLSLTTSPHYNRHLPQRSLGVAHHHVRYHNVNNQRSSSFRLYSTNNDVESETTNQQLLESLRSMRVKEIKVELESLNVSSRNALEKEELVQRLYKAQIGLNSSVGGENTDENDKGKKKKKRRNYDDDDILGETKSIVETESNYNSNPSSTVPTNANGWTITTPFIYYGLDPRSVPAQNPGEIYIRPSPGKYAAIKVQLTKGQSKSIELTLLVDTACSGLVLSPNAVTRANQQCPGIIEMVSNGGATMTMAGSSQGAAIAKWDSYTKMMVGGVEVNLNSNLAACQDIGALPAGLDGILGLSFLDQFACVDFDFVNDELRLDRTDPNPLIVNVKDVVAQGPLLLSKLRIYSADVTLDGRGPVRLLVDTGAASSFLNWKGVTDMKLSSSSPQIEPIREQIGAMGADNLALALTHRFKLKRRWNTVAENNAVGDFCPGIGLRDDEFFDIDIADLPVLETLKGDGVGGILGADLFMMCDVVRFCRLNGRSPTMILMKQ